MYAGCFSTVPAYLADMFGTQMVGAIHGRLLTAWATAGILGPVVVIFMRDFQLSLGLPREQVYKQTLYILVGMLVVSLICNLMVKPVDQKYLMTAEELAHEKNLAHERSSSEAGSSLGQFEAHNPIWAWLAWSVVGISLAQGVYRTGLSVVKFFGQCNQRQP